jgi:hypothetical protein
LLLSVGALVALLLCIYAVFFFGRKLQSDAYRRASLVEAVTAQEKENKCNALESVKRFRPLDEEKNPLPEAGKYDQWYFWDHQQELFDLPDKPKPDATKEETDDWEKKQALAVWGRKELLIFRQKLEEIEEDKDRKIRTVADKFVPKAADISVLGGGFSFLLEFSNCNCHNIRLGYIGDFGDVARERNLSNTGGYCRLCFGESVGKRSS